MPVFVAAVRRSRSRARVSAYFTKPKEEELRHPAEEETPAAENGPRASEKTLIEKNLKDYYSSYESERERTIAGKQPPVYPIFNCPQVPMDSQDSPTVTGMDQDRGYPLSPGLQQGNITFIPNGVEKSFKSRRSFSKCLLKLSPV